MRAGWLDDVRRQMADRPFAAAIRCENLDLFPHPCVFFIRGEHVHDETLDFSPGCACDLRSEPVVDAGAGIGLDRCFPLIRTNVYNPHPVFAAVYFDAFYHHGAGSRGTKRVRAVTGGYYDSVLQAATSDEAIARGTAIEARLFDALCRNPRRLIDALRGRRRPPALGPAPIRGVARVAETLRRRTTR